MAQEINLSLKSINPISHLENIGLGKRVFLVGNGPSLNDMDLDLLENEDTIAMNRIELIYEKTKWRPTYYFFCSSNCLDFFRAFSSSKYIHAFTISSFSLILSKQLNTHSCIESFLFLISLIASLAVNSKGFVICFH